MDNNCENNKKTVRDTLYGRINVSVKTMDYIIGALLVALAVSIVFGVLL
ncbi:hypothetical protein [Clostridium chauvoei]|uniref:Uncharacterized protein n=2 Tax=Clostridium chauvoei TaxID=46867 RepID=S6F025_9CLOT|nr:hypothetical protein [Clostridium chauvoei]MBX7279599.1 hypothetical protein [Clostridium chauvoei]MBX7281968.1 hypothetical protein [Clostridium chauvoei]MBX7284443.1 hypothetical protein [Clostridium chauvoei]MBX7287012.1 hypothetical protein [Clostridium chauvoei]MBX7289688.1 hypothetical protein [Clostridium chauvoei]